MPYRRVVQEGSHMTEPASSIARRDFTRYRGVGRTPDEEVATAERVQQDGIDPTIVDESPDAYVAGAGLRNAVNIAIALDLPLLVTGAPGTGKTRLADSIAHELGWGSPLVFNAKTTST